MHRTKALVSALALAALSTALLCAMPVEAVATQLLRARVGATSERTRVVLELAAPATSYRMTAEGDSAVSLALDDVARPPESFALPKPTGLLARLAFRAASKGTLLRISFNRSSTAKAFLLAKDRDLPDRLVVDVTAAGAKASGSANPAGDRAPASIRPGPPSGSGRIVVIDPGHGGEDPGAVGGDLKEKEVAFDVAKRMAERLSAEEHLKVIRTREEDERVPLRRRFRKAEEADADLFVSIHLNASPDRKASGAEVYFLSIGAATDEGAKEAARLENEVDPDYVVSEDAAIGGLPFSISLRQSDTLRRSSRLAEVVLDLLADRDLARKRGVRQAGFAVLKSYQIPSILVEVGFISSETDRKRLALPEYRQKLAEALADGVLQYLQEFAPKKATP